MRFFDNLKRYLKDDSGLMSVFGIFLVLGMFVIGALAVDISNAFRVRTQLQVAADAAAHAALYYREDHTEDEAKARAVAVFETSVPTWVAGKAVLGPEDVDFGTWNSSTKIFSSSTGARSAVLVNADRVAAENTSVGTFLFGLLGLDTFDVKVDSVFETYYPTCFREGFVAMEMVDFQSNNLYTNGFCIHSNDHVKVSNGSTFDSGTIVSMPNQLDLEGPNEAEAKNIGLADALRDGSYSPRIINDLPEIYTGLQNPYYSSNLYPIQPNFINANLGVVKNFTDNQRKVGPDSFTPYAVHVLEGCQASHKIGFKGKAEVTAEETAKVTGKDKKDDTTPEEEVVVGDVVYRDFVLVTDCLIEFGEGIQLIDAIIITKNAGNQAAKSITGASSVILGDNDGCSDNGGVTLMSVNGSVSFSADLHVYGSRVIAKDDISFTANASGIEGASFIAGGTISQTSNAKLGFCGSGWTNSFEAAYFRLAG